MPSIPTRNHSQPLAMQRASRVAGIARLPESLPVRWGSGAALLLCLLLDYRFNANSANSISFTSGELTAWVILGFSQIKASQRHHLATLTRNGWASNPAVVVWFGSSLIASIVNGLIFDRWGSLQLAKDLAPGFILFLIIIAEVKTIGDWRGITRALGLGMLALGALGTSQYLIDWPYPVAVGNLALEKIDLNGVQISHMVTGLSQHPNNFGIIVAPLVAFFTVIAIRARRRSALGMVSLLFAIIAVYGTVMKGAYFWIPVAVGLSLLPRHLLRTRWIVIATVITAASLIWFSLVTEKAPAMTMLARVLLWDSAIENVSTAGNWLFGGDTQKLAVDNFVRFHWEISHAHNAYVNNQLYFGIIAAAFFPLCLVNAMKSCVQVARQGRPEIATAARGVLAATTALAGIGMLEGIAEPSRCGLYFICFGSAGVLSQLLRFETSVSKPLRGTTVNITAAQRLRSNAAAPPLTLQPRA